MKSYTQLTQEERYQIAALLKAGLTQCEIARTIGRDKSTISRELARNTGQRGYRPQQAQQKARKRQRDKARPAFSEPHWKIVDSLLRADWSPEQIAERLKKERGIIVSIAWIYCYIRIERKRRLELRPHLRGRYWFRKRQGSRDKRGRLRNTTSIDERPQIIEQRRRIGDWEADTVAGVCQQGHLVSLVDRKSGYTCLAKVARRTAQLVKEAIIERLEPLKHRVHSITCDHGREFAGHEEFGQSLKARVYFAHPYAPWERGTNENTNGLIRQYFPKGQALLDVTDEQLRWVEERLNHRPRKRLGWKTPYEVFFRTKTQLIVALES